MLGLILYIISIFLIITRVINRSKDLRQGLIRHSYDFRQGKYIYLKQLLIIIFGWIDFIAE